MIRLTEELVYSRTKTNEFTTIKKLNCWGLDLTDVSLIREMTNVEILALSVNYITTLVDFQYCLQLQELYIRKNRIAKLEEICHLRNLPKLRSIWLDDNPCADLENYRNFVIFTLPQLEKLDNIAIKEKDRELARAYGKTLSQPVEFTNGIPAERRGSHGNAEPQHHPIEMPRSESDQFSEHANRNRIRDEEAATVDANGRYRQHLTPGIAHRVQSASKEYPYPCQAEHHHYYPASEGNYGSSQSTDYAHLHIPEKELKSSSVGDNIEGSLQREYQQTSPPPYDDDGDNPPLCSREYSQAITEQEARKAMLTQFFYEEGMVAPLHDDVNDILTCIDNGRAIVYPSTSPSNASFGHLQSPPPICTMTQTQSSPMTAYGSAPAQVPMQQPSVRPRTRHSNILSAVLSLIKELDYTHLEVVEAAIQSRMRDFE